MENSNDKQLIINLIKSKWLVNQIEMISEDDMEKYGLELSIYSLLFMDEKISYLNGDNIEYRVINGEVIESKYLHKL